MCSRTLMSPGMVPRFIHAGHIACIYHNNITQCEFLLNLHVIAAKTLLKRTPLVDPSRHKDKEKRSIEVGDEERVDLDNGKDLLVAYLGGIADYRRQIRSVDDDDDDDFLSDDCK